MKIELFKKLCLNFNKEPNEDLYLLLNEELEDYDPYYVEVAIRNIIANDKFFPTLNRILEELKNLPPMKIPEEEKIKRMKDKGVIPEWLNKEIVNEPLTEEDEKEHEEFLKFIEEFRNE